MSGTLSWYVIANPVAGGKRQHYLRVPEMLTQLEIPHTIAETRYSRHAAELAEEGLQDGHTHFVSVGGDGTHHEVVNGLMAAKPKEVAPTLALIPLGTGNDWATLHGIPRNPMEALRLCNTGKTQYVPVGTLQFADGRKAYFTNMTGFGLDAEVVNAVTRRAVIRYGKLAYVMTALQELVRYRAHALLVSGSGFEREGSFVTFHAGLGKHAGGGMQFLPHSDPTGSHLALLSIDSAPKWKLLLNMYRLFTGSIAGFPGAWSHHAETVEVSSSDGRHSLVEADGELLGSTPVTISIIPRAIRLRIPRLEK